MSYNRQTNTPQPRALDKKEFTPKFQQYMNQWNQTNSKLQNRPFSIDTGYKTFASSKQVITCVKENQQDWKRRTLSSFYDKLELDVSRHRSTNKNMIEGNHQVSNSIDKYFKQSSIQSSCSQRKEFQKQFSNEKLEDKKCNKQKTEVKQNKIGIYKYKQFKNIIKSFEPQKSQLYKNNSQSIIEQLKRKEQSKVKKAINFRDKNSLVFCDKQINIHQEDLDFCTNLLDKIERMKKTTKIIPYSVATNNPESGLEEKVPLKYIEQIQTDAIRKANETIKNCKEKASKVSRFHDRVYEETKNVTRLRHGEKMRNMMSQLKSVSFKRDIDYVDEQQKAKEQLFYAVKLNRLHEVQQIIESSPIQINMLDQNNMTALHWAVKRNFLTLAELLIKKGANKDFQDVLGRTALHISAKLNYFEMTKVLQLLLRNKVKLNLQNKNKLCPIDVAASEDIYNLINKAKRFDTIQKMSSHPPSKQIRDAEQEAFKPLYN